MRSPIRPRAVLVATPGRRSPVPPAEPVQDYEVRIGTIARASGRAIQLVESETTAPSGYGPPALHHPWYILPTGAPLPDGQRVILRIRPNTFNVLTVEVLS